MPSETRKDCHWTPWYWSHRRLWVTTWVWGFKSGSSGRAVSALNLLTIYPSPTFKKFEVCMCMYLCVCTFEHVCVCVCICAHMCVCMHSWEPKEARRGCHIPQSSSYRPLCSRGKIFLQMHTTWDVPRSGLRACAFQLWNRKKEKKGSTLLESARTAF